MRESRTPLEGVRGIQDALGKTERRGLCCMTDCGLYSLRGNRYSRMTVTSRAPWAPMTRACSMSAVLEGPAMKLPKS